MRTERAGKVLRVTPTYGGSASGTFENGGFSVTMKPNGELEGSIWVVESRVPETPQPFFQLEIDGATYQGQAIRTPVQDEHGRVVFQLTMQPVKCQGMMG